jgi:hypothetical protein
VADVDDAVAAFDALLDELTESEDSNPRWLDIAARLLAFSRLGYSPPRSKPLHPTHCQLTIVDNSCTTANGLAKIGV